MLGERPIGEWAAEAIGGARVPSSTYRVQLGARCGFDDVRALLPYLESLGVGAVYLSPVLRSRSGSTHGYDTVDHQTINPELGGAEAFERLAEAIRARGLGLVLDVVPNHMSIHPVENQAWREVLEHGPSARHADWFDIDWEPVKAALSQKVLLPVLGDQYGVVLERGEIRLTWRDGAFAIEHGDERLPFNPDLVPLIFEGTWAALRASDVEPSVVEEWSDVLAAFGRLPPYTVLDHARRDLRRREARAALDRLSRLLATHDSLNRFVHGVVESINGDPTDRASFDRLHTLLEHQTYRLAYWRTAFDEINYRRFFDINDLAAIRMEDPRVFDAAHRVVMELVGRGLVTGLRIDHPDGLADPETYFERVQDAAWLARVRHAGVSEADDLAALAAWRSAARTGEASHWASRPLYVVAEKIVTPDERFPLWAMHGGTGYRFLNQVNGLFVDRDGLHRMSQSWARRTGRHERFDEIAHECRRLIATTAMASEVNMVAHALETIAGLDRRTRDFTLNSLRQVIREVIASYPVYRTYVSERGVSDADRAVVRGALAEARRRSPVMDETIFEFMEQVLLPDLDAGADPARLRLAMRIQQITGPIQAKGLEDTAFYRYTPLAAVNEVGSHPAEPTLSVDEFHDRNRARLALDPATMTTLATHDTKRSGDARARLAALSERASEWTRAVASWSTLNAPYRTRQGISRAPSNEDEYQLYQALLAIWPADDAGTAIPVALSPELIARLETYLIKAVREAKRRSSWLRPDHRYEEALLTFVRAITQGAGAPRFLSRFAPFARSLARHGALNSLAQLALWLASPGVPDIYQGSEAWHLQLVDPDNRGPVDFSRHATRLATLEPWLSRASAASADPDVTSLVSRLVAGWSDGALKTWCLATGLRHRRRDPDLFLSGDYVPLLPDPPETPVVAFARLRGPRALIVVVPRLAGRLMQDGAWPLGDRWGPATLEIPDSVVGRPLRDRLTSRQVPAEGLSQHLLSLASVLTVLPCAWLEPIDTGDPGGET